MPFAFKLSQRLARIRRQGLVAPAVAPAIATAVSQLAVSPTLLTLHHSQAANVIDIDTVDLLYGWSPRQEREATLVVGQLSGVPMSPYLTIMTVARCGRRGRNTCTDNALGHRGMRARRVPLCAPASTN